MYADVAQLSKSSVNDSSSTSVTDANNKNNNSIVFPNVNSMFRPNPAGFPAAAAAAYPPPMQAQYFGLGNGNDKMPCALTFTGKNPI